MIHSYKLRIVLLFILIPLECSAFALGGSENNNYSQILNTNLSKEDLEHLYEKYLDAVDDVESQKPRRRVFMSNKEYQIHIKRLKEVNGFKVHNLMIKERSNPGNSYIYINNPVESKLPNAYLTLDEFKNAITNSVQIQKDAIARTNEKKTNKLRYAFKKFKKTSGITRHDSVQVIDKTKKLEHERVKAITRTITESTNTITNTPPNRVRHNAAAVSKFKKRVIKMKSDYRVTNSPLPNITAIVNQTKHIENKTVAGDYDLNNPNTVTNNSPIGGLTTQKVDLSANPTYKTGLNDSNVNLINTDTMVSVSTNNIILIENNKNNNSEEDYGIVATNENMTRNDTDEDYSVVSTNNSTEDNSDTTTTDCSVEDTTAADIEETGSVTEVADDMIKTETTDGMTETEVTDNIKKSEDLTTYISDYIMTTRKTTTVTTRRTWRTLGRPAVFMGGDIR